MTVKTTREALAEAFEEVVEGTPGEEAEVVEEPGSEVVEEAEGAHEANGEEDGGDEGGEGEGADKEAGGRKRGADGKFAKSDDKAKPDAKAVAKPVVVKPGVVAKPGEAQQQPAALKAPADWKPAAREEFAKLPRIVQEEAIRLHLETKKTLENSAQARQIADAFQRTVAPYEQLFRAGGRQPLDGVNYLLQTYQALNSAPLPQRAQIVGGLIRDFLGTDDNAINLLAATLEGKQTPAAGGSTPAAIRPEQIPQLVRQEAQRMQAEQQAQGEMKAINDFETAAPEFLNDLSQEMATLVALEKRQGKPITKELLQASYEKALRINPQTAAILKQRDDAAAAKKLQGDKGKRAAAASGIRNEPGGPAGGGNSKAKSTRDELAQQFAKAGNSRV